MHDLRFGIWTSQSIPWATIREQWQTIEGLGFDCAGLVDHFMPTAGDEEVDFLEGWTLITALAALTPRLRVAVLVSGNTYRNPALLAKQATTLDHITGGRVDLGIGAGWFVRDHEAFGWDLPPAGVRVDMLGEALQVIRSLTTQRRTTFNGEHYRLDNAPFEPKPVQERLPIMVGAQKNRMLKLVAEHADIWNVNHNPEKMAEFGKTLDKHCATIGRDPASIRRSGFGFQGVLGRDPFGDVDTWREIVQEYIAAGASEIYFKFPEGAGVKTLGTAAQILPELRQEFVSSR
ncbi:MAG: LLM class flavin-dependent oxidoreductase [Chloroflexia bacterium]|nr:LLM class flavin-dependent oxidoreductase [Chloroflexia bacterium]